MEENERKSVAVLSADGIDFVAMGKIVFKTPTFRWNIPHLHFLVREIERNSYESICLDTQLVAYGQNVDHSIGNLAKSTIFVIDDIKREFDEAKIVDVLMNPSLTHDMDGYWREFRKIEIALAKDGEDLGHKMDRHFINSIKEEIDNEFRSKIRKIVGDTVYRQLEKELVSLSKAIDIDDIDVNLLNKGAA